MSSDQLQLTAALTSLARDMHQLGVREMFGIAGDPITPLVGASESVGVTYFGFRNEQAAAYAASAVSFLTRRQCTGVCMTVAGPGLTNALTGLANANANQWPCLLVCPFTPNSNEFQYIDQLACIQGKMTKGHVFYSGMESLKRALDLANTPPFGSVVVFVAKQVRVFSVPEPPLLDPPRTELLLVPTVSVTEKLLVVIGGAAPLYPEVDLPVRTLIEKLGCAFISDPLGRGIVSEQHMLCVTAARSIAMKSASLVLVVGGKLDWMLSHGRAPKWSAECRFLLVGDSVGLEGLSSDTKARCSVFPMRALDQVITGLNGVTVDSQWRNDLILAVAQNRLKLARRLADFTSGQLPSHHEAIGAIKQAIADSGLGNSVIVSEGANTMDVARVALDQISYPCRRLDAGRWGTMGAGLGMAIAASAVRPNDAVICVEGDSAFGFSGMELETMVRYNCKIVVIVFNNGGIYSGARDNATAFTLNVQHDELMKAFGGIGISTKGGDANAVYKTVLRAFEQVKSNNQPVLVDVIIDPKSGTLSGSISRL